MKCILNVVVKTTTYFSTGRKRRRRRSRRAQIERRWVGTIPSTFPPPRRVKSPSSKKNWILSTRFSFHSPDPYTFSFPFRFSISFWTLLPILRTAFSIPFILSFKYLRIRQYVNSGWMNIPIYTNVYWYFSFSRLRLCFKLWSPRI